MEAFLQPRDGHRHHFQKHKRKTPPERRVTRGKLVDHKTGGKVLQWRGGGRAPAGGLPQSLYFLRRCRDVEGLDQRRQNPVLKGRNPAFPSSQAEHGFPQGQAGKRFPPGRSETPERTGVRRPRFRQRKLSHNCCWHLCLEDTCKSLLQITKKL